MTRITKFSKTTSYDISKILAIKQIEHYRHLKKAASATGNKEEYRRCADQVDTLVAEYGLKQNKDGMYE
ncbi:hypothetical protein [Pseudomonas sp. Kh13]|uniref:hypothetical protein n=1 Tax=Pseudomonas sp. Kh13 TaxID=2093744 RepID=UPI001183A904|nr:hypothetical protein [Pseudomonas sp. Kh13]